MDTKETGRIENKGHNIVVLEKTVHDGTTELTPEAFTGKLRVSKPDVHAVGIPAVVSSIEHAWKWMSAGDAVRTMFKINQKGGFDCPGCAWPDPDDERSALGEYCENGMKAIAEEATNKRLTADFFKKHSVQELSTWTDYALGKSGRLTEPMILRGGNYEPISWAEAFKFIASELNALGSPDEAIFYTSGRASNEAAFLYQLFIREYGTNNLPDCSNMCHESSGKGLSATLGLGKGSVTLDDFNHSELIIVMGQNPGTNHPRMLSALEKCKENGGKIIAINPLPEAGLMNFTNPQSPLKILKGGTKLADMFLQVKINGDVALLKAMMFLMLEAEKIAPNSVFDHDFIKNKTAGFDEFIADLATQNYAELVAASGVPEPLVREAAQMCIAKKRIIVCWAMGLTQHKNAVGNVQEIVNLLLLRGSIGIKGGGTCPVRGHSNVQGDRTMGIWEAAPDKFLDKIRDVVGFEPPRKHGYDVVAAIRAMYDGLGKVFFALGGNFISATPDTEFTAEALRRTNLTVHVSTKLNRSHLIHGKNALILPCLGRTEVDTQASGEQFVTCENSMGVVQMSRGLLQPCSTNLMSETAIVCYLAAATLGEKSKVDWSAMHTNYDNARDLIAKVIGGFDNFNEKVRRPEGFYLPNPPREQQFSNTNTQKANFSINPVPKWSLKHGEYMMMTIRSHDQFNTTIYGMDDRYRGIFNERRVILMNAKDMVTEGVKANDVVDLFGYYNGVSREARQFIVVPYDIPLGDVATYFPEANTLIPIDSFADKSKTPTSKSVVITMKKA
ncbi:MAG: FdhF/YdeP family oxidoreductase [Saprospiraceae bacterium]|nr:FdhF/YdeP family oxidoreductase [Saprospiraceae bacterium]